MAILPKLIHKTNAIPTKISTAFLENIIENNLKSQDCNQVWNQKRPIIPKAILDNKSKAGGIIISDFKLYYKVTEI